MSGRKGKVPFCGSFDWLHVSSLFPDLPKRFETAFLTLYLSRYAS